MIHATKNRSLRQVTSYLRRKKRLVEAAIIELEEAQTEDKELITAKTTGLTEASAKIAEKLHAKAEMLVGDTAADTGSPEPEDDVVDAEFEEVKDDEKK